MEHRAQGALEARGVQGAERRAWDQAECLLKLRVPVAVPGRVERRVERRVPDGGPVAWGQWAAWAAEGDEAAAMSR